MSVDPRQAGKVKGQVYVSYAADDELSQKAAEYLTTSILQPYGAKYVVLTPLDGILTYVDYEGSIHVCFFASPEFLLVHA